MNQTGSEISVSIIIPCFNEASGLRRVLPAIQSLQMLNSEVLVVDDGSSDDSASIAAELGARVIAHPYNIGNGAAVKSGIRASRGKVLVFLDADGQHEPGDIPRLLEHMPRYHMTVGARTAASKSSAHRLMANKFYNWFASFIVQFEIEDLTSGFRAMRRVDALRFCDMLPNGFSYPTTSTLAFIRSGRAVKYIPIVAKEREGFSKIKIFRDGFEFFIIIMKITMAFSPLRVFLPISSFLFFLGIGRYVYTYITAGQFTNMSALLINTSVIVFMLGLIAEQIASLRFERGDNITEKIDS